METRTPTILTTSQMLTTGVDAPTCKNVVLARIVGSMSEFKQIIGRGTRVRDDHGKLWFNIVDYTGSATRLLADPAFDGEPARLTDEEIDAEGQSVAVADVPVESAELKPGEPEVIEPLELGRRKFYFDGGQVEVSAHLVYELDPAGQQLRVVRYTDFAAESVRLLYPDSRALRAAWLNASERSGIVARLAERGIDFGHLAQAAGQSDADPFDLLCHLTYNAPLRTRRDRARQLKAASQTCSTSMARKAD